MSSRSSSEKPVTVYGAMAANFAIAITKFIAAAFTGSSAMLSEGIHSLVDTGNQILLLLGIRRSKKPADEKHPFGYGKEVYFWGLIVAILLFGIGGGMSIYEGIIHMNYPNEIGNPIWNYIVLGLAAVFEGSAFSIALAQLLIQKDDEEGFWEAVRSSKDPAVFVVLAEDAAALSGLAVAALGVYLGHKYNNPYFDGIASVIIGFILAGVAFLLAYESRDLLIGESIRPGPLKSIDRLVHANPAVEKAGRPMTMHFGPNEVLLNLNVQFKKQLSSSEIAAAVDRLESSIRKKHPEIKRIFIEAEAFIQKKPAETTVSK
ncbi:MAG: cation diffusion facilitator family transporter [Desulfococcaceae bacterium]